MVNLMKIALVGTHNSGKTTLFNLLKKEEAFKGYSFVPELVRELKTKGFGINESAKDDTQLALALLQNYYTTNEFFLVMDRCILDTYIYAQYLAKRGIVINKVVKVLSEVLELSLREFDYIFICSPEFEFENDGQRDTNKEFQEEIHTLFLDYAIKHNTEKPKIRILTGNSQERLEKIKETIPLCYMSLTK